MIKGLIYALVLLFTFGLQPFLWWWSLTVANDIAQFLAIFGLLMTAIYQIIIVSKVYKKIVGNGS